MYPIHVCSAYLFTFSTDLSIRNEYVQNQPMLLDEFQYRIPIRGQTGSEAKTVKPTIGIPASVAVRCESQQEQLFVTAKVSFNSRIRMTNPVIRPYEKILEAT